MFNLIIIISSALIALLAIHVYAKWQIRKLTKKTFCLHEETVEKENRIKKIEELARNKLVSMSYSEQITKFISDGIVVGDREKILYANPAMTKITGYSSDELINQPWAKFIIEEDLTATNATFESNFNSTTEIHGVHNFINRWRTKAGNRIALWWSVTPFDENGICYGICRDVTRQNGRKEKIDFLLEKLLGDEYNEDISADVVSVTLSNGHDTTQE